MLDQHVKSNLSVEIYMEEETGVRKEHCIKEPAGPNSGPAWECCEQGHIAEVKVTN
jgi:hypothetical protein